MITVRKLQVFEIPLLLEGGRAFFAEANMPGGFDDGHFLQKWKRLIESEIAHVFATFNDGTICGALAWIVSDGLFNKLISATEAFWFVFKQHRLTGVRLLDAYERWCFENGVDLMQMIHLADLQAERLGKFYVSRGYRYFEKMYVKEVVR